MGLPFILDEDVPRSILHMLREEGHNAEESRTMLPKGSDDNLVVALAHEREAILITWNHKDYARIVQRTSTRCPKAGLITFHKCDEVKGAARLLEVLPLIEFIYALQQAKNDKRIIVEIREASITIR